ncbi:ImmA/IrrE family metallo-endopeptidase [Bacillus mojavensis]|uniref:ImmA/IrrE family metallo-endopeptidase n=1 Tax=Bacillus subtilis group TaxID=653685 RepID=UPI002DBD6E4A|nr:ImmA/IrrE family metallo-endopeptidase [Bacillus mojavensis]MEC1669737.1 ImmA/IrrE family metallo-endopeptidase [Bacillus mojavensis]
MVESVAREKKLAQKIIKKYSLSPPVDIRNLIENYAKCEEDSLPNNADAICIMNIERPLVILDNGKSENRKRFTLAHELGHLIIPWHSGMISCHTDNQDVVDKGAYHTMEAEANSFAAEILMPSEWLKDMVTKHEEKGLVELLEIVSSEAQVSISAAFFSVINHLPNGYIFYIKSDEWYSGSLRRSQGTNIIIPKLDAEYDWRFMEKCAVDYGDYKLAPINIVWWKFPKCLTEVQLIKTIEESDDLDLNYVFNKVSSYGTGVFAASFLNIIGLLPRGYLVKIRGVDYGRLFRSPNTNISVPNFKSFEEEVYWFKKHASKSGIFEYQGYKYFWGYFVVKNPVLNTQDKRLSKNILKDILKDCYEDAAQRQKYLYKINGIVGSLNNRAPDEFEEFYRMFKERFIGVEIFSKIVQHPDFEAFIINKVIELLERKSKS